MSKKKIVVANMLEYTRLIYNQAHAASSKLIKYR
jgi:hypothetical protein